MKLTYIQINSILRILLNVKYCSSLKLNQLIIQYLEQDTNEIKCFIILKSFISNGKLDKRKSKPIKNEIIKIMNLINQEKDVKLMLLVKSIPPTKFDV